MTGLEDLKTRISAAVENVISETLSRVWQELDTVSKCAYIEFVSPQQNFESQPLIMCYQILFQLVTFNKIAFKIPEFFAHSIY